jgi:hypothetical protein
MKTGLALPDLARELQRQLAGKRDYLATTTALRFETAPDAGSQLIIRNGTEHAFAVTEHAHGQLAARLGIPRPYFDRMRRERPELLDENVNAWLQHKHERRLIRTLDSAARAYLSERYRRLDNFDLAEAVLPLVAAESGARVESAQVTATRFYLKAVFPRVEGEVKKGDVVQAGICVSNSEVGAGSLSVQPLVFRLACLNGLIVPDATMKRHHIGRAEGGDEEAHELFADETLAADDRAFFLKVRDLVKATLDAAKFNKIIDRLRASTETSITGDPVRSVEVLSERFGLNDGERGGVLRHLVSGGDLSQYGVIQAVTAFAQDSSLDYETATRFEQLGGEVLELSASDWRAIASAN